MNPQKGCKMLDKRDIGYAILSRFENTFRRYLSTIFSSKYSDPLEGIPVHLNQIKPPGTEDESTVLSDLAILLNETNLTDLKDIAFYKTNFNSLFPDFAGGRKRFGEVFDRVYTLRCKVAHIKGCFLWDDLHELIEKVGLISEFFKATDDGLDRFLEAIRLHPEAIQVAKIPDWFFEDKSIYKIPNNLPLPDYDLEGGFVGRKKMFKVYKCF
jgi:LuxR family transcriptional regulator, glucitol operon activator